MDDYSLQWKGPWHGNIEKVPEGHEVLAEFPSVVWGWIQQKPEPLRKPNEQWEWHHVSYRANSPF